MQTIGQIAVRGKTLLPGDSLARAADAVHMSGVGAALVVENGYPLGLITAPRLARALATGSAPGSPLGEVPLELAPALPAELSPREALGYMRASGLERAPVVDATGTPVGIITLSELLAALCGRLRPPVIGGMATPFGVYLAGGGTCGGVGDLALICTGAYLALVNIAAVWVAALLFLPGGYAAHVPFLGPWLATTTLPLFDLTWILLFAVLFRLSPITGYHAAEHQVVHTLEAGDDLRPEELRKKPRVHPRCGTNLCAAVLLMQLFWEHRSAVLNQAVVAMLLTFFLWRRVGSWLQQHVTTRPASLEQLESGIAAAKELLKRYQERPATLPPRLTTRIWQMGLLQVLAGWMAVLAVLWLLGFFVELPEVLRLV